MATPSSIGMNAIISPLAQLPDELLLESIEYLDKCSLVRFGLSCKWAYGKAMPLVWNEIKLVDCRTRHNDMPYHEDEHDDTPIIHKLITLSRCVLFSSLPPWRIDAGFGTFTCAPSCCFRQILGMME